MGTKLNKELETKLPVGLGFKLAFVSKFLFFLFPVLVPRTPHPAPRIPGGEGKVKEKLVSFLSSKEMSSGVFRAFVKIRTESSKLAVRNTE